MPGTFVAIGWNGPRILSGALGFMSQRSIWLGAPALKIRMTDLAFAPSLPAPAASARIQSAQNSPRAPIPVVLRNRRRVGSREFWADLQGARIDFPALSRGGGLISFRIPVGASIRRPGGPDKHILPSRFEFAL